MRGLSRGVARRHVHEHLSGWCVAVNILDGCFLELELRFLRFCLHVCGVGEGSSNSLHDFAKNRRSLHVLTREKCVIFVEREPILKSALTRCLFQSLLRCLDSLPFRRLCHGRRVALGGRLFRISLLLLRCLCRLAHVIILTTNTRRHWVVFIGSPATRVARWLMKLLFHRECQPIHRVREIIGWSGVRFF